MVLLNKLLKGWFDEIFFGEREVLVFPHCDYETQILREMAAQDCDHKKKTFLTEYSKAST